MSAFEARWHNFHSASVWFSTALLARTLDRCSMQVVVCHKTAKRSRGEAGPANLSPMHIKPFTRRSEARRSRGEAGVCSLWFSTALLARAPPRNESLFQGLGNNFHSASVWFATALLARALPRNESLFQSRGNCVCLHSKRAGTPFIPPLCGFQLLSSLAP